MSLVLFEGAAGTGKSTRLLGATRERLAAYRLGPEQRVLALTKYHGSRRRMEAKLKGKEGVGSFVDCITIDSFAWKLVRRWRALARQLGAAVTQGDFQAITAAAGLLLQQEAVGPWVARRYPLVLVDELQDCTEYEITILAGLTPSTHCICAADAFQDLSGNTENKAICWAKSVGEVIPLHRVHRTNVQGLIAAADALRRSERVSCCRTSGFEVIAVPRYHLGGARMCWSIKSWGNSGQIAIISPTKPGTSPFVDGLLLWASANAAKSRMSPATAGPFTVRWEAGDEVRCREIATSLKLPEDLKATILCSEIAKTAHDLRAYDLRDWFQKQRNVGGRETVTVAQVLNDLGEIVRRRRAFGSLQDSRRFAVTVYQAKNCEFENVIVLWPLKIKADLEQQRRLLYNAITRAKRQALVIVEDPRNNRLGAPPFGEDPVTQ
jgi:hypothetical protein